MNYIFIDCCATSFTGKDGNRVNGYSIVLLETVEYTDGRKVYNLVKSFRTTPLHIKPFSGVSALFNSRGKLVDIKPLERG